MTASGAAALPLTPPTTRRIRAYFAPVSRADGIPTIFDPAQSGNFDLDDPPTPLVDLGWIDRFERKSGSMITALRSGAPGFAMSQVRTEIDTLIVVSFLSWGKLQMAITAGSEQMNLLAPKAGAAPNGSGGSAGAAIPIQSGSTASFLNIASGGLTQFYAGQMIVADVDYTGQTGYVGSGIRGAYVSSASSVHSDANYIRRVSFNVSRIASVTSTGLQLAHPLIAGAPPEGMSVQPVLGFTDREGSTFFQEWSGLFAIPGEQGDRIFLHFPRLQIASGGARPESRLTTQPAARGIWNGSRKSQNFAHCPSRIQTTERKPFVSGVIFPRPIRLFGDCAPISNCRPRFERLAIERSRDA